MENYKTILKKYNQDDLLKTIDSCSEKNKTKLISQLKKIDFKKINKLYEISNKIELTNCYSLLNK